MLGLARLLSNSSKRCRDVPAPSGALALLQACKEQKTGLLPAGLAGVCFKPDWIPAQNRVEASRLCSDLEAVRAGRVFKLASTSLGCSVHTGQMFIQGLGCAHSAVGSRLSELSISSSSETLAFLYFSSLGLCPITKLPVLHKEHLK